MAYIPHIVDYKPFYIQTGEDDHAVDTTEFGLVAKTSPYPVLPTPKDPYKNEFFDEDGDQEYTDSIHYKSFEFNVSFFIKVYDSETETSESIMRKQIDSFFAKIMHGEFMTYDTYTGIGFSGVRYAGYKEEGIKRRQNWTRALFSITFKVNNPLSRITMVGKTLVEE